MPRLLLVGLAVLSTYLLAAAPASACDCVLAASACKAFGAAEMVFAGRVISTTGNAMSIDGVSAGRVEFAVVEPFRGVTGSSVTLANGPGNCAARFKVGETYLVYAHRRNPSQPPVTNMCSRTAPLARAQEDLAYARSMASATPGTPATLRGSVRRIDGRGRKGPLAGVPVAGVTVIASGPTGSFRTVSSKAGEFVLTKLPPGAYSVRVSPQRGLAANPPVQVEVADPEGCGVLMLWVRRRAS